MSQVFTKSMARNIFYGGGMFFFLLFLVLTFDTINTLPKRDNRAAISPAVAQGKLLWEENNCLGCHTLLGEGAYFAPELGNIYTCPICLAVAAMWSFTVPRSCPGNCHCCMLA